MSDALVIDAEGLATSSRTANTDSSTPGAATGTPVDP